MRFEIAPKTSPLRTEAKVTRKKKKKKQHQFHVDIAIYKCNFNMNSVILFHHSPWWITRKIFNYNTLRVWTKYVPFQTCFSLSLRAMFSNSSVRAVSGRCRNSGLRKTCKSPSILWMASLISLYLLISKTFRLESLWKNSKNCLSRASGYKNS